MNKHFIIPAMIVLTSLSLPTISYADSTDKLEHPVTALHEQKADNANKDLQEHSQEKKETLARLKQAKKDYEESLAKNGADSDITKQARSRFLDAKKEYQSEEKKTTQAAQKTKRRFSKSGSRQSN